MVVGDRKMKEILNEFKRIKERRGNHRTDIGQQKTNNKMVNINLNISVSVIILNVNRLFN